ncbi:Hypothetical protein R9X50_00362600 [Acrodontium crateriforme]|uniref:Uncharacterized protein n=1 Tax=Acrodontium crateriforme TaxID=150365 RepID=A0AAQ3R9K1_9PEZI|nr:Hypothetical protein R9X50_00362600 [Acrodontium crateriforme]
MAHVNVYGVWAWARTVVWCIGYPIGLVVYFAAVVVLFVARLLYRPVAFLLLPLLYVAHFLLAAAVTPFQLLAKLETLYIFLGVAAITGIAGGLIIGSISGSLNKLLRLDATAPKPPGRTAKQYRKAKQKQKVKSEAPLMTSGVLSPGPQSPGPLSTGYFSLSDGKGSRGRGLLNQTIMEEMDSDY